MRACELPGKSRSLGWRPPDVMPVREAAWLKSALMSSDDAGPYWVNESAQPYRVADAENQIILTCQDRMSAHHYAELLNRAYRAGYKAGYRAGKVAAVK